MADNETNESDNTQTPEIRDPMSLRDTDTSRLKRIKPQTSLRVANVDGSTEVGSETVHLKVIKEKKKQLAGILSASQTIRLRPSNQDGGPNDGPAPAGDAGKPGTLKLKAPGGPKETSNLARKSPGGPPKETSKLERKQRSPNELVAGDKKSPTLKLKSPVAAESKPALPASPPTTAAKAVSAPQSDNKRPATLKLKAPGETKLKTHSLPRPEKPAAKAGDASSQADVETSALSKSTLKLRAPGQAAQTQPAKAAPAAGGTLKLRAPSSPASDGKKKAPGGSPGTLKLRAPGSPAADGGGAGGGKATLKLRAPTSPGGGDKPGTLKLKAPSATPQETVKQEAPAPGKTLKLRSTPTPDAPTMEAPKVAAQPVQQSQAQPGIVYTLGAVASFGLVGFMCYLTIVQYLDLFQVK